MMYTHSKGGSAMKKILSVEQLYAILEEGCAPSVIGPVVARYLLWDDRMLVASYYGGDDKPDVVFSEKQDLDGEALRSVAKNLLVEGRPLITEKGSGDMVCTLTWKIIPASAHHLAE